MSSSFFPISGKGGIAERRFHPSMHRQRSSAESVSSSTDVGNTGTSRSPSAATPNRPRRITMAGMIYDVRDIYCFAVRCFPFLCVELLYFSDTDSNFYNNNVFLFPLFFSLLPNGFVVVIVVVLLKTGK